MNLKLDYKMGQKVKTQTHQYIVMGFEYIYETNHINYKFLYTVDGGIKYVYMTKLEVELLK